MSKARVFFFVIISWAIGGSNALAQKAHQSLISIGTPDSLYSRVLEEERTFWVHLPGGAALVEGQRYPVIYLLDGEEHLSGLAAVQHYYNQFRMPEMIVVAISNSKNRTKNLTPTHVASRNGAMVQESGGSDEFESFLADELIPLIDSTYPTTPHRVLVGHSYGGLFAINTLINSPDLFTNYIAIDPSLDWDDSQWVEGALNSLESKDLTGKGLYVSIANEIIRFSDTLTIDTVENDTSVFSEGIRASLSFVKRMEEDGPQGLRFDWMFSEKDIHGSIPLVGMRNAFVYLYDFWELKSPSLYNDPDTPTETLISMIRAQSEARSTHMGYALPLEEELLEMLAFMSVEGGQLNKALALLNVSAEYYPDSEAVHSSLVDVCLMLEDYTCAEKHAQLADGITDTLDYMDKVRTARQSKQ